MIVIFENVIASEAYNCLFCHEGIYSACWLIVEFDCENDMACEACNCLHVIACFQLFSTWLGYVNYVSLLTVRYNAQREWFFCYFFHVVGL